MQERERLARLKSAAGNESTNVNGKRPLKAIPADHTEPSAPGKRSTYGDAQGNATASGSGSNHFKRDDPSKPLKNMVGDYVDYDLSKLKNTKGGFLLENDEDDPRRLKERQMMEKNKAARLDELRKKGALHEPGSSSSKLLMDDRRCC